MKPIYTEQDLVLKHPEIEGILTEIQSYGILRPEQRAQLITLLETTKTGGEPLEFSDLDAWVGKDPITNDYLLVIRNIYDPRNLLTVLFERLTTIEEEDPEMDRENALSLIETYLGIIEKREKISLEEIKKKLAELTRSMKDTLAAFQKDEFSDKDFEKLSEALDRAYFEPISELLEGVLVAIAGN